MGEASGGVGNGVDGVGAVDAGVGEDAIGVGHGANGAVDQGGVGLGLPLPAARHNGAKVVGADANVGGVGDAEGGVGNGVGSAGVGDGVSSDSIGVSSNETSAVHKGGVSLGFGLSLPLAVVSVGVVVGIGVGGISGNRGDGSVGDHADVVGPPVLDRLGNVGSCGNLANSPGLSLGRGEMIFYLF